MTEFYHRCTDRKSFRVEKSFIFLFLDMLSPVIGRHGKLFSNIDRMSSLVRDFGPILSFLEVLFGESLSASLPDSRLFIRDYF